MFQTVLSCYLFYVDILNQLQLYTTEFYTIVAFLVLNVYLIERIKHIFFGFKIQFLSKMETTIFILLICCYILSVDAEKYIASQPFP